MSISVPKMANIIVASGSRGRHLPSYINRFHSFHHTAHFTQIIIPGATIEHIHHAIISNFQQNQQSSIIPQHTSITVSADICNLTTKNHHQGGTEISYNHSQETIDKLIQSLQTLSDSFNTDTTTLRITSIPPSSLIKSRTHHIQTGRLRQSIFTENSINEQHQQLQQDICSINKAISQINTHAQQTTIRWDRDLMKTEIKKEWLMVSKSSGGEQSLHSNTCRMVFTLMIS